MESGHIVASIIIVAGTIVGLFQVYRGGDGAILAGLIGLYGTVLGFVFGKTIAEMKIASDVVEALRMQEIKESNPT